MDMVTMERPLAAALAFPHLEAGADRLVQHIEPLGGGGRERQAEAIALFRGGTFDADAELHPQRTRAGSCENRIP
jgi:hypothetical protein